MLQQGLVGDEGHSQDGYARGSFLLLRIGSDGANEGIPQIPIHFSVDAPLLLLLGLLNQVL